MPRFSFRCTCGQEFQVVLPERSPTILCQCGLQAKNVFRIKGGVTLMERLDNGVMGRAVERIHNIEEILKDVADKDTAEFQQRMEFESTKAD